MSSFRRLKFVVLGWAAASLFFTALLLVSDAHKPPAFALYSSAVHFALWSLALPLLSGCSRKFPLGHGRKSWNGTRLLLAAAISGSVVMFLQWTILYLTFFPYRSEYPTFRLFLHFLRLELGRFLPSDILIGIVIVVALQGWRVWLDFQAERTKASDLQQRLAVARLEALRMQLHPHFLFNTLHTIAGLIVEQPAMARRMVIALGDLLRLTLKEGSGSVRSLAEELEFADLYLGIEKLRIGDRLVLDYDIDPDATSAQVPQLLLQPLFENAVRHGAARLVGPCQIRFCARRQGDRLKLMLSNDGLKRAESSGPRGFGVGLTNTMARLRLHYQDRFSFQYSDRPQGGAQIDLVLPYEKADLPKSLAEYPEELYASSESAAHARIDHR